MKQPKKQKPRYIISITALAIGLAFSLFIAQKLTPAPTFRLSPEYYQAGQMVEISATDFQRLTEDQKNFIVMAHMLLCPAEAPLTTTVEDFTAQNPITVLTLTEEEFAKTSLHDTVKYLPSAAIYRNGKLVAYLDAESDNDLPAYQSAAGFRAWLSRFVSLNP